ncbi:MAG: hypothetical protein JNM31_10875 [Flavobacteriales bacterium]|nr:hypothetical protein [Flavobacteriales bacterium]
MVRISFLTLNETDAVALAAILNQRRLLMFDTIEEHVDLLWDGERPDRRTLVHLCGFTKALLYSAVERTALETLGDRLVRIWAQPVTSLDQRSTRELMDWTAKV